jgi:N-acetylglutamate synthase-like GNAT family acetyltransferase
MEVGTFFNYPDVTLVPAVDSDVVELVELINHAYSYQNEAKGEPRTNPVHLKKRMDEVELFVAKHAGKIVGCVYIEPAGRVLKFGLLTVNDDHRGKGLAPAMMHAIENFAKDSKYHELSLDYMSLAPWLKKYYERYGFYETGKTTGWGTIDLIEMRKPLNN